jgi:hypothetical protein
LSSGSTADIVAGWLLNAEFCIKHESSSYGRVQMELRIAEEILEELLPPLGTKLWSICATGKATRLNFRPCSGKQDPGLHAGRPGDAFVLYYF